LPKPPGAPRPAVASAPSSRPERIDEGTAMTDSVLTKKQGLLLLQELISNPGFRKRFADKPAAALLEIGVPAETVVNLNARCLAPRKETDLASEVKLVRVRDALEKDGATESLSMWVPNAEL
jgi:putative modified peptide